MAKLSSQLRKALIAIIYIAKRCLEKDQFTLEDLDDILTCLVSLIQIPPFTSKFLKWLGQFCLMPEVQEGAKEKGGAWAVRGLKAFARIVRGL